VGRYTLVVDTDIDPTNLEDIVWVIARRCDLE
jgi:UbiD family decarboxylase